MPPTPAKPRGVGQAPGLEARAPRTYPVGPAPGLQRVKDPTPQSCVPGSAQPRSPGLGARRALSKLDTDPEVDSQAGQMGPRSRTAGGKQGFYKHNLLQGMFFKKSHLWRPEPSLQPPDVGIEGRIPRVPLASPATHPSPSLGGWPPPGEERALQGPVQFIVGPPSWHRALWGCRTQAPSQGEGNS